MFMVTFLLSLSLSSLTEKHLHGGYYKIYFSTNILAPLNIIRDPVSQLMNNQ